MPIKNFKAPRQNPKKEHSPPMLVSDYMSAKLVTFKITQSILEIMDLFIKHRISGGPVLDENGSLVGIVSEADCMKQISESRYFNMPILEKEVSNFMTKDVETVQHDMTIFDAASLFYKNNRRRLPVVENGRLVGQISRKDIVIAALKLNSQNWK